MLPLGFPTSWRLITTYSLLHTLRYVPTCYCYLPAAGRPSSISHSDPVPSPHSHLIIRAYLFLGLAALQALDHTHPHRERPHKRGIRHDGSRDSGRHSAVIRKGRKGKKVANSVGPCCAADEGAHLRVKFPFVHHWTCALHDTPNADVITFRVNTLPARKSRLHPVGDLVSISRIFSTRGITDRLPPVTTHPSAAFDQSSIPWAWLGRRSGPRKGKGHFF